MSPSPDPSGTGTALELAAFIDASPSPYHAVAEVASRLTAVGSRALEETAAWELEPGLYHMVRGGGLVAFRVPEGAAPGIGLRILGAHTDSPNLRVKPRPNHASVGVRQLGVEVYGGVLLNSWLDRDLGLSGRAVVRDGAGQRTETFRIDRPLLRVPQLAIHLDREIHTKGLLLNKQTHMAPLWALGAPEATGFEDFLSAELGGAEVLAWDAMCHDLTPSRLLGRDEEFLAAPRLDNLCSSYVALAALLDLCAADGATGPGDTVSVVALFDHEEVGSESTTGAGGLFLGAAIERVLAAAAPGATSTDRFRSLAASACCSADMAHATHPNYVERHEPDHLLAMNGGPTIKINASQRYATNAPSEARFQLACERAGVPFQKWVNRTDLGCGSTIGPITAARLGIETVDVGCPQLSMHSAREVCGSLDPGMMRRAMVEFLRG